MPAMWRSRVSDALTAPSRYLARGMVKWTVDVVLPRPKWVIGTCLLVVMACAAGVHRIELATATDELWVPQDTRVMRNRDRVGELFGSQPQWHSLIVTSLDDSELLLTPDTVSLLFQLEQKINNLPGWNETCFRIAQNTPCVKRSVTSLWCSYDAFTNQVLNSGDPQDALLQKINSGDPSCQFGPLERLRVLGVPSYNDGSYFQTATETSGIVNAQHILGSYVLDWDKGQEAVRDVAELFEQLMITEDKALQSQVPPKKIDFAYSLAFDKEIQRSVTGDIPLVVAAFVLITCVTPLTQFFKSTGTRKYVSFATAANYGVLSVALGIATGYGVVIWCGVRFTSLAQVGPFIFLGVGVDDVVIILEVLRDARERLENGGNVRKRFQYVAERAGVSIAITSITNFLAFALGSLTVIPAVQWFCLYASVTILCDFIIVMSFFLSVLVLLETRDQANGIPEKAFSLAVAETRPLPPATSEDEQFRMSNVVAKAREVSERVRRRVKGTKDNERTTDNKGKAHSNTSTDTSAAWFPKLLGVYGDVLMKTPVRITVITVFLAYSTYGLVSFGEIDEGLPRTALAPDDSFLQGYFSTFDDVFESQVGIALEHHFRGFKHSTPTAQASVYAAWGIYLSSQYIRPVKTFASQDGASPSTNWLLATVTAASYLNVSAPCVSLGVSESLCALAAVPFGGTEVTGANGPLLLPEPYFLTALNLAVAQRPEIAAVLRRTVDVTSASGLGPPVASTIITRAVPVADEYPLQLKIYNDMMRVDTLVEPLFFTEDGAAIDGIDPIVGKVTIVSDVDVLDADGNVLATPTPKLQTVSFDRVRTFTFNELLVYWQQDAVLWDEIIMNLSLAGTGVFIVCWIALAHPAAIIAVAGVGVVDVFLFTSLVLGKIRFNVISMINLVMAVGLAVDYTLHFCHAFLSIPGIDRKDRVKYAFLSMGSSILKGGGTTIVGTLPMAFSRSTIFRTFFALLFSTIVYSLAVGLILIPVVLSLLPLPIATHLQGHGVVPDVSLPLDRMEEVTKDRERELEGDEGSEKMEAKV